MRMLVNDMAKGISLVICLIFCACFSFAESCSAVGATQYKHIAGECSYTTNTRTCCSDKNWSNWGEDCISCGAGETLYNGICCNNRPPYVAGAVQACWEINKNITGWLAQSVSLTFVSSTTNEPCNTNTANSYFSARYTKCASGRYPGGFCTAAMGASGNAVGYLGETCYYSWGTCGSCTYNSSTKKYSCPMSGAKLLNCTSGGVWSYKYLPDGDGATTNYAAPW